MVDILSTYAKLHPELGYRQGMHEILAVVLTVVRRDAVARESWPATTTTTGIPTTATTGMTATAATAKTLGTVNDPDDGVAADALLATILDDQFALHDTYLLFEAFMNWAFPLFATTTPSAAGVKPSPLFEEIAAILPRPDDREYNYTHGLRHLSNLPEDPIMSRVRHIVDSTLPLVDRELATFFQQNYIHVEPFLFRWLRMLFLRDLPFDEVLPLWDCLLAEDPDLTLLDDVCVVVLVKLRRQIMDAPNADGSVDVLRRCRPFDDDDDGDGITVTTTAAAAAALVYSARQLRQEIDEFVTTEQDRNARLEREIAFVQQLQVQQEFGLAGAAGVDPGSNVNMPMNMDIETAAAADAGPALAARIELFGRSLRTSIKTGWNAVARYQAVVGVVDSVRRGIEVGIMTTAGPGSCASTLSLSSHHDEDKKKQKKQKEKETKGKKSDSDSSDGGDDDDYDVATLRDRLAREVRVQADAATKLRRLAGELWVTDRALSTNGGVDWRLKDRLAGVVEGMMAIQLELGSGWGWGGRSGSSDNYNDDDEDWTDGGDGDGDGGEDGEDGEERLGRIATTTTTTTGAGGEMDLSIEPGPEPGPGPELEAEVEAESEAVAPTVIPTTVSGGVSGGRSRAGRGRWGAVGWESASSPEPDSEPAQEQQQQQHDDTDMTDIDKVLSTATVLEARPMRRRGRPRRW